MTVCGVTLRSRDAILVVAEVEDGVITLHQNATRKLGLGDEFKPADVKGFGVLVETLIRDFGITHLVIRKPTTGYRSAGAAAFVMAAVFQLVEGAEIQFVAPQTIAARDKRAPINVPSELRSYQADAYRLVATAFAPDR